MEHTAPESERRSAAPLQPLGADYDRFLYAQVGTDRHGGYLSVISALARAGVDPWEQAAILARMPVDVAAQALCVLLARLPARPGAPEDPVPLATHLVSLLPRGVHRALRPRDATGDGTLSERRNRLLVALASIACLLAFLVMQNLIERSPASPVAPAATTDLLRTP
jgi:hypothetical protein